MRRRRSTPAEKPIEVAIIGGGCASIATAFELTRPAHKGRYHVTIYQLGWRLGGKGASGRGPAGRIQEHGLHVWLGFYENAFRLLRECYAELGLTPGTSRFSDWRDAFVPDSHIGMADCSSEGDWLTWTALFPPGEGLPGDPLTTHNPFSISSYCARMVDLLRTLLLGVETRTTRGSQAYEGAEPASPPTDEGISRDTSPEALAASMLRLLRYGVLATTAGLIEGLSILEVMFKAAPASPQNVLVRFLETLAASIRSQCEAVVASDDEIRCKWEIIDLVVAILVGAVRFGLLYDPRGLDAINEYECREWLRMNGASERSLNSAFVRGLYDLALAYEDGDPRRPRLAAGQALRGSLRMFFTYRGSLFWKMRAGMGDVVFAPYYEVLKKRGVSFQFFHRLEHVKLSDPAALAPDERPYVEELRFDVQARIRGGGEYRPLVEIRGTPCWPSNPDYPQLVNGPRLRRERWDFESHWDRRKVDTRTLRVTRDFDFVVLGVSIGVIPFVCQEILAQDPRWRTMVDRVKTVASQSFQIWMREDMAELGWSEPPVTLSGFAKPFDTWADMGQCVPEENWKVPPKSVAYFCGALPDPAVEPVRTDVGYPSRRYEEVRRNAIAFLNEQVHHLWPKAVSGPGRFRWELLVDPHERASSRPSHQADETRFASQYWRANVNPTDRYVLALPGSLQHRISPLDNTYDNLTISGDWTDCGFNEGCVEAAVMSGRLAAHAISQSPPLEDIIGYDHP